MKIVLYLLAILVIMMITRFFKRIIHFQLPFNEYFLDSGYRRRVQPPQRIIYRSGIKNGMTVLQEIPDQQKALAEVWRVLKPNGIFAVTEVMADPDYPLKRTTIRIGENAGFTVDQFLGNLWEYTICFRKS
jgi:SAM-dependent methyltransferase